MKNKKVTSVILLSLILLVSSLGFTTIPAGAGSAKVEVIVGFTNANQASQAVRNSGGRVIQTYTLIPALLALVPESSIAGLQKNPNVEYTHVDGLVYALQQVIPWGIGRIKAPDAWAESKGGGVKVAIVDTGIGPHADLVVYGGYDFVNVDDDPSDDNGHGTHVAGTIAALNNDLGVVGVAPEVGLYAVKVLDDSGSGTVSGVINGIEWSVNNGMQIISMSLGTSTDYRALHDACDAAYNRGLLLVAAAGNSGNPAGKGDNVGYPAKYGSVIAVAATNQDDKRASWSSTGPDVELAAPGVDIYSTWIGSSYATKSGTSMACPHASGTAALVWAKNPGLTNAEVRKILQDTATDLGSTGKDSQYGYGLVNAYAAVLATSSPTPPAKVTGLTVAMVSESQLDLSWDANTETDLDHYNLYRSTTSASGYSLVASPTTNSYSDVGLTASTTYYYAVTAVDVSGHEGESSDEASGTTAADATGPETSNVAASPNPTNGATSVTLTASVDDSGNGNSPIVAAEYFVGTVGADGAGTPMEAFDGAFDQATEGVFADIDVSTWAVGAYTIYVHGKDAADNWGGVSSVVLEVTEETTNTMHVASIDMWYEKKGINYFIYAKVKIVDSSDNPVSGATVYVELKFPDGATATGSGDTDSSGFVTFKSSPTKQTGTYKATVTNVVKDEWTYDAAANVETNETLQVP